MADQNLNIGIKVTSDTAGAKQATAAIDGVDKAVADLAKTEKEATNINGMYLDSLGRIHDASGRFVKVSKEEREGLKERIKLQQEETGAVDRSTVTTNGAAQAKEKLAKSSNNGAMGLLALSNAVQDVQYGFGGMVNNIPQIITGLGMGMGVAGAVQIAAVGVQFLLKNVDLFGEKAKEAAKAAAELSGETMADANAAYKAAEATKAQAAAQESLNAALAVTEGHYKAVIALSEQIIKQKQAEKDAETALADAQAGMEMARIALAESRGEMTKEDAIFAKEKVRTEADARKQTAAIAMEETKIAEARRKAAAEDQLAREKRRKAEMLSGAGEGLLNKEERDLAKENKASLEASLEASRIRQAEAAQKLTDNSYLKSGMAGIGGIVLNDAMIAMERATTQQRLQKERAEAAKTQAALDKENAKLSADELARKRTNIQSRDELNKTIAAEKTGAGESVTRASLLRVEAMAGETGIRQSQQVFGMRQATGAMQAQAQIEAERARRQAEADKAAADRAREVGQVGTAGGSLAATLAGDGISTGFTDSLRKAAGGAGDAAGLDRLIAMVAKLTTNSAKLSEQAKSKLDKLEAEIEDLRTAK
jgi:hypothetical protein